MRHLQKVKGHGNLFDTEPPGIPVEFYYDVFQSDDTMMEIRGKIISDDFKTLFAWFQSPSRLTLQTDTFSLHLYISDDQGGFKTTGGPMYHNK